MQFVEPIRDLKKISQIRNILKWEWNIRDLFLFEFGIKSALRISDLLNTQVKDLFDEELNIKDYFDIKESKTWKTNRITITNKVKEVLKLYKEKYPWILNKRDNYIFFSKKSVFLWKKSITRKMSWVIISKLCKDVWLVGNYWNHSLRKTWWYQARLEWISIEIIQHKLNHSSLWVTMRYLGITMDEIKEACDKLDF